MINIFILEGGGKHFKNIIPVKPCWKGWYREVCLLFG